MKYSWGAKSSSDAGPPLGYPTEEEAKAHAERMNILLDQWETSLLWNKEYWKTKPEPWNHFAL